MSKQKPQITTLALPTVGNESSNAGNLIKKSLYHWPLFILCSIITLIGAYFYMKVTNPVYPILATLEFKAMTASSAGLPINTNATEEALDPINKPVIVENEIEVMQSKKLMYEVVNDLKLWVSCTQKKGLKTVDLYKKSPVDFKFLSTNTTLGPTGEKLQITIKDHNEFLLKDSSKISKAYKFSTPIKSAFGTWQLDPTDNMADFPSGAVIDISVQDPDLVSDGFQTGIKVALENKDAPFVNLSTSDQVPQRGKDILNSLMALYIQGAIADKSKQSQNTLKFIDSRLDSLRNDLDAAEKQIESFKSSQGLTDIIAVAQSTRDLKQANMKAVNDVEVNLGIVASLEKFTDNPDNSAKMPAAIANLGESGLMTIYDKLTTLTLRKQELLATTPEANPVFTSLNNQIAALKADFSEKLQSLKSALLAQKRQLGTFDKGLESSLVKIPAQDREYNQLKRTQESKENIYKFLLEKKEQVSLRYASSISDSEVVDDAHAGKVKWPNAPIVYVLGLLIGLGAALGILYLRESLNDRITNRKQIEDETEIPILGELSYQENSETIVVSEGRSKFAIGEQFRVLRTNLYHLHGTNEGGRVTLFTSSVSSEGKSFVSSNIAVTLAYASRKTVILEMDLRKPKVSVNFNLSTEHPGISSYLNEDTSDLKKLIQPSGIPNLDVLGCGPILPNPSELLEKERLDELIAILRTMYDDIIIDSPPIHLVTDALIIARVADASLYVVRQGYTHKYELEFMNEIDNAKRFPKFNIVFNGVKKDAAAYGYGYSYSYSYNNYYNNSYADKEKHSFGVQLKAFFRRF